MPKRATDAGIPNPERLECTRECEPEGGSPEGEIQTKETGSEKKKKKPEGNKSKANNRTRVEAAEEGNRCTQTAPRRPGIWGAGASTRAQSPSLHLRSTERDRECRFACRSDASPQAGRPSCATPRIATSAVGTRKPRLTLIIGIHERKIVTVVFDFEVVAADAQVCSPPIDTQQRAGRRDACRGEE